MNPLVFLVVDDEPEIRTLVRANVRAWGHEIRQASNGPEALGILENEKVDVLLADVAMQPMQGTELIRTLRERGQLPPHVYVLSALPPEEVQATAEDLGVGWIQKPFTAEELREPFAEMLDG